MGKRFVGLLIYWSPINSNMTISVIIPIYKVQEYVRRCLESVIAQECDRFSIECLIINDCTPDDSMTIVHDVISSYQGNSIEFKVIHHQKNMGLSVARNTGIKAATGDFIYFIDSDDHIMENTFKSFVSKFVSYPFVDVIVSLFSHLSILFSSFPYILYKANA